jgi:CRISPR-associated endonuclease/helicase Cas3
MTFLAHSARPDRGISEQLYSEHVANVVVGATRNADSAARYSGRYGDLLRAAVGTAAEFHDLGKIDDLNQSVLRTNRGKMFNHVDAGVAHLLDGLPSPAGATAALAAFAHHIGLPGIASEMVKGKGKALRDAEPGPDGAPLRDFTNLRLPSYLDRHRACVPSLPAVPKNDTRSPAPPLTLRVALSCLVDADHSDTARHYGDTTVLRPSVPLDPVLRLRQLDDYVAQLACGSEVRDRLRADVYRECRDADPAPGTTTCDSPVGSGKTTAVMAHLLRAADLKRLRRIFVVLPFTNIIDQSVDVYRRSLTLPDEDPDEVVVAHHHRAEFDDLAARQYSFLWHAPLVVTTAVQFFETLAARSPVSLRKLHQVPGSAIFIDEAHAALPAHLWPQAWKWLSELAADWNCHVVLGSGSLSRFWELRDFVDPPMSLPAIVPPDVRTVSAEKERDRVEYRRCEGRLGLEELTDFLTTLEGPRLLIVNTVQSAAAIARYLARVLGGEHVEHLSTALTPRDRKATLDLVRLRLRQPNHRNWTLVATSCIEAGVDISFRVGVRERCGLNSLLQISGRVNRSGEYRQADVWDIQLRHDHLLRPHPAFEASARILGELFDEGSVCADLCTEALRREITQQGMGKAKDAILKAERNCDFPEVEKLFKVISSKTLTAVVDRAVIERLERGEKVSRNELQAGSVQIWQDRENDWGTSEMPHIPGLKKWNLKYDSFLGYMAGVLPLVDAGQTALII